MVEPADGPGQRMVDWGSFKLKPSARANGTSSTSSAANPLDLLDGTASRGLSMARTLGTEEADQVTVPGRRVLIGWTGPGQKKKRGEKSTRRIQPCRVLYSACSILESSTLSLEVLEYLLL